jgi:hypothetical protein
MSQVWNIVEPKEINIWGSLRKYSWAYSFKAWGKG